jgi:hypothetical protein
MHTVWIVMAIVALVLLYLVMNRMRTSGYQASPVVKGICLQFYNNQNPQNGSMYPDMTRDENWNDTRTNDLRIIKALGASVVRTYEFGFDGKHGKYFSALEQVGLQTGIPVSDYNLNDPAGFTKTWVTYLGQELTVNKQYRPCIHSVMIFNEPELQAAAKNWPSITCNYMQAILDAESQFGVTGPLPLIVVPVSFGTTDPATGKTGDPGKVYIDELEAQMKTQGLDVKLQGRYMPGINTTNPLSDMNLFDSKYGKPFMITEYGPSGANMNADNVTAYFTSILTSPPPNLRGVFAFQYFDPTNKANDERKFGMTCWDQPFDDVPLGDFCSYNDPAHPNSCPPPGTAVGDKNGLIAALSKAYGGTDVSGMFGIKCGGGPPPPPPPPGQQYCLPKKGTSDAKLGSDVGWACGQGGTDCSMNPCAGNVFDTATYVFSKYYKEHAASGASCDFGGDAQLMTPDSTINQKCLSG